MRHALGATPLEQRGARQHGIGRERAVAVAGAVADQHGVVAATAVAADMLRLAIAAVLARRVGERELRLDRAVVLEHQPVRGPWQLSQTLASQMVAHIEVEALAHDHDGVPAPERLAGERREPRIEPEGAREFERLRLAGAQRGALRARQFAMPRRAGQPRCQFGDTRGFATAGERFGERCADVARRHGAVEVTQIGDRHAIDERLRQQEA